MLVFKTTNNKLLAILKDSPELVEEIRYLNGEILVSLYDEFRKIEYVLCEVPKEYRYLFIKDVKIKSWKINETEKDQISIKLVYSPKRN